MYRGLWKIEESFKLTKSELEARTVYVWTKEHIEAHILTCFVALTLTRILEMKLHVYIRDDRQIQNALSEIDTVDILVNNAGVYLEKYLEDTTND